MVAELTPCIRSLSFVRSCRRVRVPTRKRVRGRKKPVAVRKSRRVRGVDPSTSDDPHPVEDPDDPEEAKLLTCDEYYAVRGMDATPVRSEGFFTGWVNDEVRARYGIADDPDKAWNENGGGQFTFKISKKGETSSTLETSTLSLN